MSLEFCARPIDTDRAAEELHRRVHQLRDGGYDGVHPAVKRAVAQQSRQLLYVLEQQATRVDKIAESQLGETRRLDARATWRVETMMVQMWREALNSAVKGEFKISLAPYYYAAASWCGIVQMPSRWD